MESDAEGKFSIDNVEPGRYWLSAERQGFVKMDYGARRPSVPGTVLTLEAGKDLTGLMFKLVPQGIIAGRVLDDEGEPLSGVMVQVLQQRYMQRRKRLVPAAAGVQTNDLGEYRVANLSPGEYKLFAWEDIEPGAAEDEEFRKPFESRRVDASLDSGVRKSVQTPVILRLAVQEEKAKQKFCAENHMVRRGGLEPPRDCSR